MSKCKCMHKGEVILLEGCIGIIQGIDSDNELHVMGVTDIVANVTGCIKWKGKSANGIKLSDSKYPLGFKYVADCDLPK